MLNGLDPIILFNFFKMPESVTAFLSKIPLVDTLVTGVPLIPIPLYLNEKITGIYIDTENKNIDIETSTESKKDGGDITETQRALNSSVTIEMLASKSSLGLTLMSAMMDVILKKVTSREYSITYLHGSITVFNGKLHSFSINQNADNTLYRVSLNLSQASQKTAVVPTVPTVPKATGFIPL